jgi:diguanylate cyclase (GGDEF)-like protein
MNTAPPAPLPRLLLVDDQPLNIQVLYQSFAADHQVFMATSGAQALAVCAAKQPDLILLDLTMPDMDGYEVCRRLKADPASADIPVIFVTASTDNLSEEHGLALGAVDFIAKPVNPVIVRARVKTHLTLKAQADQLRLLAYIDGLTGVRNRRYLDERLDIELRRAARLHTSLSVVMIDVDFFKRYNDRHGHQAGDDCLRRVAAALGATLKRPGDLLARYGGEEFACLLPDTDLGNARQIAERLRRAVQQLQIVHGDSAVAPEVTVSLGVACSADAGEEEQLMRRADACLYRAKEQGRNRVGDDAPR